MELQEDIFFDKHYTESGWGVGMEPLQPPPLKLLYYYTECPHSSTNLTLTSGKIKVAYRVFSLINGNVSAPNTPADFLFPSGICHCSFKWRRGQHLLKSIFNTHCSISIQSFSIRGRTRIWLEVDTQR